MIWYQTRFRSFYTKSLTRLIKIVLNGRSFSILNLQHKYGHNPIAALIQEDKTLL